MTGVLLDIGGSAAYSFVWYFTSTFFVFCSDGYRTRRSYRVGYQKICAVRRPTSPYLTDAYCHQGRSRFSGQSIAPGLYFGMWFWQYDVTMESFMIIPEGKIGW